MLVDTRSRHSKTKVSKEVCLADAATDKHNRAVLALDSDILSKVIHRFVTDAPASAKSEQSQVMHPLRKIIALRAGALLLVTAAIWQQQDARAGAQDMPTAEPWQAPLSAPMALINPYFQPTSDYSAGHRGVDYRVNDADPVFAPVDSIIWFSGTVVDRQVLTLRTLSGDLLEFEPVCSAKSAGEQIRAGDEIGQICPGTSNYRNHCTGQTCMHFSLRTSEGYLSPLVRFGSLAPTVLLPRY